MSVTTNRTPQEDAVQADLIRLLLTCTCLYFPEYCPLHNEPEPKRQPR